MGKEKLAFVSGASGYIAQHILVQLLEAGWHVRGSVRSLSKGKGVLEALQSSLPNRNDIEKCVSFVELDLTNNRGWTKALEGVDVLLHTASPFPMVMPKDEQELIVPAVDGALIALRSALEAGVNRVIFTSSTVSIMSGELLKGQTEFSEKNWSDTKHPTASAYVKSKTLAEKAAWDFVDKNPEIQLTVINPGLVLGRPLGNSFGTSVKIIERLLNAKDPAIPDLSFAAVDVKDVASMHVRAIDVPETIGQRFVACDRPITFLEIANVLKQEFPNRKIVTRKAPYFLLKIISLFDPAVRGILPNIGKHTGISNRAAKSILEMEFRDIKVSVKETADYLIENKVVD